LEIQLHQINPLDLCSSFSAGQQTFRLLNKPVWVCSLTQEEGSWEEKVNFEKKAVSRKENVSCSGEVINRKGKSPDQPF
jgi:hypothetical protein